MQLRPKRSKSKEAPCPNSNGEISLSDLSEGAKGIIAHTSGGLEVVRRLSDMGLTPGCEVKLIRKCSFHGPIEVEVRGVSLALGYDLSQKICVHPLKANSDDS
jgi:ferrous iron transport protein A